jgi:hypothetical protein
MGHFSVEVAEHFGQSFRVFTRWGVGNEMVVVGKDGPSFQMPLVIGSYFEKAALQYVESLGTAEVMFFLEGSGGDDVGAAA